MFFFLSYNFWVRKTNCIKVDKTLYYIVKFNEKRLCFQRMDTLIPKKKLKAL